MVVASLGADKSYYITGVKKIIKSIKNHYVFNKLLDTPETTNVFNGGYVSWLLNGTEFKGWERIFADPTTIVGSRIAIDTHHVTFEMILPPPMIEGKLYVKDLSFDDKQHVVSVKAIASSDIVFSVYALLNEYYQTVTVESVRITKNVHYNSKFECRFDIKRCYSLNNHLEEKIWRSKETEQCIQLKNLIEAYAEF
jgi:hypothetical protein